METANSQKCVLEWSRSGSKVWFGGDRPILLVSKLASLSTILATFAMVSFQWSRNFGNHSIKEHIFLSEFQNHTYAKAVTDMHSNFEN